jgi:hypothetical protein
VPGGHDRKEGVFFEKKTRKTFMTCVPRGVGIARVSARRHESRFASFASGKAESSLRLAPPLRSFQLR